MAERHAVGARHRGALAQRHAIGGLDAGALAHCCGPCRSSHRGLAKRQRAGPGGCGVRPIGRRVVARGDRREADRRGGIARRLGALADGHRPVGGSGAAAEGDRALAAAADVALEQHRRADGRVQLIDVDCVGAHDSGGDIHQPLLGAHRAEGDRGFLVGDGVMADGHGIERRGAGALPDGDGAFGGGVGFGAQREGGPATGAGRAAEGCRSGAAGRSVLADRGGGLGVRHGRLANGGGVGLVGPAGPGLGLLADRGGSGVEEVRQGEAGGGIDATVDLPIMGVVIGDVVGVVFLARRVAGDRRRQVDPVGVAPGVAEVTESGAVVASGVAVGAVDQIGVAALIGVRQGAKLGLNAIAERRGVHAAVGAGRIGVVRAVEGADPDILDCPRGRCGGQRHACARQDGDSQQQPLPAEEVGIHDSAPDLVKSVRDDPFAEAAAPDARQIRPRGD